MLQIFQMFKLLCLLLRVYVVEQTPLLKRLVALYYNLLNNVA
jgi:hypothetical protein